MNRKSGGKMAQKNRVKLLIVFCKKYSPPICGDVFKKAATTFVSSLAILLGVTSPAFAETDLTIGASTRSYPLSGVLEAATGYGVMLWGDQGSPWYGYTRLELSGASAATYNSGMLKLELFPLSFLGARVGGESMQNDQEYRAYDCLASVCKGRFYRRFFEAELTLGAGPLFIQGRWRRDHWTQGESTRGDFIDPTSGLLMLAAGDMQTVYQGLLGIKFSPEWSIVTGLRYAENEAHQISRFPFLISRWKSGGVTYAIGGGAFKSELKPLGGSFVGYIEWEIWPSLALK